MPWAAGYLQAGKGSWVRMRRGHARAEHAGTTPWRMVRYELLPIGQRTTKKKGPAKGPEPALVCAPAIGSKPAPKGRAKGKGKAKAALPAPRPDEEAAADSSDEEALEAERLGALGR